MALVTGERERRFASLDQSKIEARAEGIGGTAIVTDTTTDIGPFTEEISREAVEDALEQDWDIRGLFNHDPNFVLGRTSSGTMTLRATDAGLEYDIPKMPESRADVMEAIERGDVSGNSFSFTVAEEEWKDEDTDHPHRTVKRFGNIFDIGPVSYPAYPDTVVSARCMEVGKRQTPAEYAASLEYVHATDWKRLHEMRRRRLALYG